MVMSVMKASGCAQSPVAQKRSEAVYQFDDTKATRARRNTLISRNSWSFPIIAARRVPPL
jgi:hypothetical protein